MGSPVNVQIRKMAHCFHDMPTNNTKGSPFGHRKFLCLSLRLIPEPLAPEASVLTELPHFNLTYSLCERIGKFLESVSRLFWTFVVCIRVSSVGELSPKPMLVSCRWIVLFQWTTWQIAVLNCAGVRRTGMCGSRAFQWTIVQGKNLVVVFQNRSLHEKCRTACQNWHFSFCPAKTFRLSDKCPVNLSKENNILTTNMPSVPQILICAAKDNSLSDSCPASVEKISRTGIVTCPRVRITTISTNRIPLLFWLP